MHLIVTKLPTSDMQQRSDLDILCIDSRFLLILLNHNKINYN